jgi:tRNA-uridine 2-sulfurtransferase
VEEKQGFEPWVPFNGHNSLAVSRLRPLGHLSIKRKGDRKRIFCQGKSCWLIIVLLKTYNYAYIQYMNQIELSKKTVYMMMSGGVDSSVAASVLVDQGYNVIGVFMKCWSVDSLTLIGASKDLYGCFWEEDSTDARLVANRLGIPFYVWDFEKEYKKGVVDYMLDEYRKGRTPNPDVMCNSVVKFGIFYQKAIAMGADFVATGHYARVTTEDDELRLRRGKDMNKDQSYFVWRIKKDQLPHILMPIGEFDSKAEVRDIAEKLELVTARKPDSQGLCFIGETPVRELLLQTLGEKEGQIVEFGSGKILGSHQGAFQYTIGQRHQLGLSGGPWFVHSIDVDSNKVFVAHDTNQKDLFTSSLIATDLNIFHELKDGEEYKFQAQIRYRQTAEYCVVIKRENEISIQFNKPVRAISKGQSVVVYSDDILVVGGVIS